MGLFSTILEKLGFSRPAQAAPAPQALRPPRRLPRAPVAITVVDVMSQLDGLAAANPQKLNWKVSIVDL